MKTRDLVTDWLMARLGSTSLGTCIVPVRVQRGPRVGLGRDFLREEDRLVAGTSVFTPWHAAALCGPDAKVVTHTEGGRLRIGIVVPDLALRSLSAARGDDSATLDMFVANPLHADRLRWRAWRRLTAGEPSCCGQTVPTPANSLEEAFVRRETNGVMDDLVRSNRGLLAPSSSLEPWRRFVRLPLRWLAVGGPSHFGQESVSAHWFEVDWPEAEPVDLACDVVLFHDQVLAKAEAVRSQGTRLGVDKCRDLHGPQRVRILAIWDSDTGEVLESAAMPWIPAGRRYRSSADVPRANEAMVVEVPKPGTYTILMAGSIATDLAAGTSMSVHHGNERLLGGSLLEPARSLAQVEAASLWSGLVSGLLGDGSLLRPADFVHAIRTFQPFGVADWSEAGETTFRSEARQIDRVMREVLLLSVPVKTARVSVRDLEDARNALAAHLQRLVGRPVAIEVRWTEAA